MACFYMLDFVAKRVLKKSDQNTCAILLTVNTTVCNKNIQKALATMHKRHVNVVNKLERLFKTECSVIEVSIVRVLNIRLHVCSTNAK